jgi:AmmeMemoRadiSam system protein A
MLRGCIGNIVGRKPLIKTITEMAHAAAFDDPRFPRLKAEEFNLIDIEISVLSPLHRISSITEIQTGVHGIYMTRGFNSGVLLPQVATEQAWDRNKFVKHTCLKAGLPEDAWKDPLTVIEIFSAVIFSEKIQGTD